MIKKFGRKIIPRVGKRSDIQWLSRGRGNGIENDCDRGKAWRRNEGGPSFALATSTGD